MIHITESKEDKQKLFGIYGWLSDGRPITRIGTKWIAISGQSRIFYEEVQKLEPTQEIIIPFKTTAGEVTYRIKRVK